MSERYGQHFLTDPNLARLAIDRAGVRPDDVVLEIGPGRGILTVELVQAAAAVQAVEIDRRLERALAPLEAAHPDLRITWADAMQADLAALDPAPTAMVANLPYNVATPVLVRLLEEFPEMQRALVMVQREVGERLVAGPGTKAYGAVSVKVGYYAEARIVGSVAATVFVPPPGVASALVRIDRRPAPPVEVPSPEALFALVRTGFAQRRKMLRRALEPALGDRTEPVLVAAGIDPRSRAEALTLDDWARVCREAA